MDNQALIATLNDLIETSKDGEDGFRTCADDAADPQLKKFFYERAQRCAAAAMELQDLVRAQGGAPETSGGLSAAAHRRWIDIKALITGRDDTAVLAECERGEDFAVASYRRALEKDLPTEVRAVVERQYQGVLQNQQQVRELHDRYRRA